LSRTAGTPAEHKGRQKPVNYIKQLQAANAELEAKLTKANAELGDLLIKLHSAKFTGVDSDGSRKDWIATGDVIAWAREVRSELF
jgi:hypothetical protein